MPSPSPDTLLIDFSHTSHTRANTGIQRLCRSLFTALSADGPVFPVCLDPYAGAWRELHTRELASLAASPGSAVKRGAQWSWQDRISGRLRRAIRKTPAPLPPAGALLEPEIFSPAVAARLPELFRQVRGPRVALFFDAIPLKFPEHTPRGTVARFPEYLQELTRFDGVAAISEDSRDSLLGFWAWLGLRSTPPVIALPLAVEVASTKGKPAPPPSLPVVLSVGTLEGRKNHAALLDACERLWAEGLQFELHLIGMPRRDTGKGALEQLRRLQGSGRPLRYEGAVSEEALQAAYRRCHFTVYPSLYEGFGFPVFESLLHGKPCICSQQGALREAAAGGGCLIVERPDASALSAAIRSLLQNPALHSRLVAEARQRTGKSWREYASDLRLWMAELPQRNGRG